MREFTIVDLPDQQFGLILNGRRVTLRLRYNVTTDRWSFDLSIDDRPVLHGRRVVCNVDLIAPFGFDIGSLIVVPRVGDGVPDRQGLINGDVRFLHVTQAEINEAISS